MEGCEKPLMPVQNHVITIIIRLITTLLKNTHFTYSRQKRENLKYTDIFTENIS